MEKYKIKKIGAFSGADIKHLNSLSKDEQGEYLKLKLKYYECKNVMILFDGELAEFEINKKFPSEVERIKHLTGSSHTPIRDKELFHDTDKKIKELENLIKERNKFYVKKEYGKDKKWK